MVQECEEAMSINAIKHQINAARLRLVYFQRLHAQGVKRFASHDVEQEIRSMKAKLAALEGE